VHISALSNTYVKDPRDVVKSGDVVRVKVLEVDEARKRIGLTLRLTDEPGKPAPKQQGGGGGGRDRGGRPQQQRGGQQRGGGQQRAAAAPASGSMADALRKAGFGK
jgi:uncharacterized protein